jgi:hypothetical protein
MAAELDNLLCVERRKDEFQMSGWLLFLFCIKLVGQVISQTGGFGANNLLDSYTLTKLTAWCRLCVIYEKWNWDC